MYVTLSPSSNPFHCYLSLFSIVLCLAEHYYILSLSFPPSLSLFLTPSLPPSLSFFLSLSLPSLPPSHSSSLYPSPPSVPSLPRLSFSFSFLQTSKIPLFVPGVWGPYYSAMVPGYYLNEGGQSAAGSVVGKLITPIVLDLYCNIS